MKNNGEKYKNLGVSHKSIARNDFANQGVAQKRMYQKPGKKRFHLPRCGGLNLHLGEIEFKPILLLPYLQLLEVRPLNVHSNQNRR